MAPNLSLADECALNVKERVGVGLSVTLTEGGVERLNDFEDGVTVVVLNIDPMASLTNFNVLVRTGYHYNSFSVL